MFRTKASTYAILATLEIAKRQKEENGGIQAGEIARELNLPAAYAAKVLTQLARANVLRSDRGPRGGFRLMRDPEKVDVLEIVEAVDGSMHAGLEWASRFEIGDGKTRAVDGVFDEVVQQVRAYLRGRTLNDLLGEQKPLTTLAHLS
jgi:Rrf2 family protein